MTRAAIALTLCLLIIGNAAYARHVAIELNPQNLNEHQVTISFKEQANGLVFVVLEQRTIAIKYNGVIQFRMHEKLVASTPLRVERKGEMAKMHFHISKELLKESILCFIVEQVRSTTYTLKLNSVYEVSGIENKKAPNQKMHQD